MQGELKVIAGGGSESASKRGSEMGSYRDLIVWQKGMGL